jgi:hypothetical protein
MKIKLPLQLNKCLTRTRSSSLIQDEEVNTKVHKNRVRTRQQQKLTNRKNSNIKKRIIKNHKHKND